MREFENSENQRERVFSKTVRAGKRTYFFDVRATKTNDYFITLTESKRKFQDGGYIKSKIFLYKEDFNKFLEALQETVSHVKSELLPDYDYDQFSHKSTPENSKNTHATVVNEDDELLNSTSSKNIKHVEDESNDKSFTIEHAEELDSEISFASDIGKKEKL